MKRIERELQGTLATVFTERIKARNLIDRLSAYSVAEEARADITIKDNKGKTLFFIELKDPIAPDGRTAGNADVFKRESKRAAKMGISYFSICNFVEAIFYDQTSGDEFQLQKGKAFQTEELSRLRTNYHPTDATIAKLTILADWHIDCALSIFGEKTLEKTPLDEAFIYKIQRFIEVRAWDVSDNLWQKFQQDRNFKRSLELYARAQEWQIPTMEFEMMDYAYIALLMLVSKLMVYKAFVDFKEWKIPPLAEPPENGTAHEYYTYLWDSFDQLKEITGDFELLFGERDDIINRIPFLAESSIDLVHDVLGIEERYNFANLPYDIVGRIFEGLIREDERHKRGQYFTSSRIVDIINAFCIRTGNESVLDPSCGSGTFLVRAYQRKKELAQKPHKDVLNEVTGIDISGYATHLAMLNLAMRDLRLQCYPRIIQRDFFHVSWQKSLTVRDLGGKDKRISFENFDAVVGNPPYTRQEDIDAFDPTAKTKIIATVKQDWKLEPPSNTSIYAHFFYHAGKMVKNKGYLGFIVQNSWLDTRYGETLQNWMLQHFRIVAIIDTKVERFFTAAEVNTNIVILQREESPEAREKHSTKFVYLQKPLAELSDYLTAQQHIAPDEAIRTFIESCTEDYADEYWTIRLIPQRELASGKDKPSIAWSSYLRAPDVYWRIMARGADKWQPLSAVADVRFGIKTGANEFFFVRDVTETMHNDDFGAIRNHPSKRIKTIAQVLDAGLRVIITKHRELWLIEAVCLVPVIKSSQDIVSYQVKENQARLCLIKVHASSKEFIKVNYPFFLKYLKNGEDQGFHTRPSCIGRSNWWDVGEREYADAFWFATYNQRFFVPINTNFLEDKRLYGITFTTPSKKLLTLGFLNSTLMPLFYEIGSRLNFGEGATEWAVYQVEGIRVPMNISKTAQRKITQSFQQLLSLPIQSIFDELGALTPDTVELSKVSSARVSLDRAVLEAIGFADHEQDEVLLELYKAVVDLVSSRLAKAHSVDSEKKQKRSVEVSVLVEELESRLAESDVVIERSAIFSTQLAKAAATITPVVKEQNSVIKAFWQKYFKEQYNHQRLLDEQQLGFFTD